MALTAEHVERITAFIEARTDEARKNSWTDQDDVSRALRALTNVYGRIRARAEAVTPTPWSRPELDPDGQINRAHVARQKEYAGFAWNDLRDIARAWEDHPDYHPDFALLDHELRDAPAAAEAGKD